ncbi:MAG: zinc ribbon domain-containing protein [Atopobiaceae bacterium]|nr:zinc ribbon domain-containing protein [Atopobiaceae bacterium]
MVCPYCQTELPDGARYCGECGGDLTLAQVPVPAPTQQTIVPSRVNATHITPKEEHDRNTKIGVVVVVSIGVVAILCGIISVLLLA